MPSKAQEQFVQKCKDFWETADADDNGKLTPGELAKVIRKAAPNVEISDAAIAEIFLDLDDDGSRTLDFEEFSECFMKKPIKDCEKSELMDAFKNLDSDGSGSLSPAEVRQQFQDLGVSITDEELENTISNADTDGDGKINYQEFLKCLK